MTADPPQVAIRNRLRDGTAVLLRPIWPNDKDGLVDGLARMSMRSRLMRFLAPVRRLTESDLCYLTEIDFRDHMAWVALDLSAPGRPGIGVARCVRVSNRPDVAEPAIAVVDSHQRLGLGPLLLGALARSAAANGIAAMEATVLADNRPMLKLLRDLGGQVAPDGQGLLRVSGRIPRDPDTLALSDAARLFASAFRALPQGSLHP